MMADPDPYMNTWTIQIIMIQEEGTGFGSEQIIIKDPEGEPTGPKSPDSVRIWIPRSVPVVSSGKM